MQDTVEFLAKKADFRDIGENTDGAGRLSSLVWNFREFVTGG